MADITVTAAKVALVDPTKATVKSYKAAAAITKGQAIYIVAATGLANLADANGSGTLQFRGIALNAAAAGQAVDVCEDGEVAGFTLSGNYDTALYLSNTAGALADAAGAATIICGRVAPMSDKDLTKVARIFVQREADWA